MEQKMTMQPPAAPKAPENAHLDLVMVPTPVLNEVDKSLAKEVAPTIQGIVRDSRAAATPTAQVVSAAGVKKSQCARDMQESGDEKAGEIEAQLQKAQEPGAPMPATTPRQFIDPVWQARHGSAELLNGVPPADGASQNRAIQLESTVSEDPAGVRASMAKPMTAAGGAVGTGIGNGSGMGMGGGGGNRNEYAASVPAIHTSGTKRVR
ncbi:MAG: hypothetical protein WDN28_22085 [Chthoniobacter sp.]